MALPQRHISKIHDAQGKPFRYRKNVYRTLFWLIRHTDRKNHTGLVLWVWLEIWMLPVLFMMMWLAVSRGRFAYRITGSVPIDVIFYSVVIVFVMISRYCVARSLMHYAASIDLKAATCPACGYPLSVENARDGITDSMCSECGRIWTSPPQWDHSQIKTASDRSERTTDAAD